MLRVRAVHILVFLCIGIVFQPCLSQSKHDSETSAPDPGAMSAELSNVGGKNTKPAPFRVSVDLVLVPVTVTDALNHPQMDLTRQDFSLYQDNQAQQIRYFSAEDAPISVGLLLDVSKSMQDKIETERAAVAEFFKNANPNDDYFVITFNNGPRVLSDVTQSTASIETELGLVEPGGSTALLDAIYLGVDKLRDARYPRHALVIISDGGDNSSHYSLREVKSMVAESDVIVYAIGLFDSGPFKTFEEAMGRRWLSSITDVTGGRTITVEDLEKLPETSALLSRELRSEYMLGFESSDKSIDAKWRKIRVVVNRSSGNIPLRPYYRKGYYALAPQ
jgi:Ca-activated chloride channel homolog